MFDKGTLQDDKGQEIDFRNTIILLTTNAAGDAVMRIYADPDTRPDASGQPINSIRVSCNDDKSFAYAIT